MAGRILSVGAGIVAGLACACLAWGAGAAASDGKSVIHVSKKYGYSITLSSHWDTSALASESDPPRLSVAGPAPEKGVTKGGATFKQGTLLTVAALPHFGSSTVDQYVKKRFTAAAFSLKDWKIAEQGSGTLGGDDARFVITSFAYPNGVVMKRITYVALRGDYAYEVGLESMEGEYDRALPMFKEALESFKFTGPAKGVMGK